MAAVSSAANDVLGRLLSSALDWLMEHLLDVWFEAHLNAARQRTA